MRDAHEWGTRDGRAGGRRYWAAEAVLRWRCRGMLAERVASFLRPRSASLTDSESGKASSRSGAMITTFVPCRMRWWYLPRTPLLKSRLGLGASGLSASGLFILFSLGCGDGTGSDESDSRVCLSVIAPKILWGACGERVYP